MNLKLCLHNGAIIGTLILILFCSCTEEEKKPTIILIFTDDQGTLDAGCYGSVDLYTPNIDRLSKTGVRFTKAFAHTVCCPSRAA